MIPLRITINLSGPIYLPYGKPYEYMIFDSFIAGLIAKKKGFKKETLSAETVDAIEAELDTLLKKITFSDDFYYAASAIYVRPSRKMFHKVPWTKASWIEHAYPFCPSKIGIINRASGPNRLEQGEYTALVTPQAYFWCVGDPDKISEYLDVLHFTGLGARHAAGGGPVLSYYIEQSDNDYSVIDWNSFPARSIPVEADYNGVPCAVRYATYRIPYWDKTKEKLCYMPRFRFGENVIDFQPKVAGLR